MRRLTGTLRESWRLIGQLRLTPELVLRDDAVWVRGVPRNTAVLVLGPLAITAVWLALAWSMDLPGRLSLVFSAAAAWPALAMLAVLHAFPPFEARIGDGVVQASIRRPLPLGKRGWQEPLSSYRGLHAMVERWRGPTPYGDLDRAEGSVRDAGDPSSLAPRHRDGLLILEHATNSARCLVLTRRQGRAIDTAFAKEVAERIGLPLRWTH